MFILYLNKLFLINLTFLLFKKKKKNIIKLILRIFLNLKIETENQKKINYDFVNLFKLILKKKKRNYYQNIIYF